MTRQFWQLLFLLLMCLLASHTYYAQSSNSDVDLNGCWSDLVVADTNGDNAVSLDEYLVFVNTYAVRKCAAPQSELSLQQRAAFVSLACQCQWDEETADDNNNNEESAIAACCLEGRAKLPTTHALEPASQTESETLFLTVVCIVTDQTIPQSCANNNNNAQQNDSGDSSSGTYIEPKRDDVLIDSHGSSQRSKSQNTAGDDDRDWWWWFVLFVGIFLALCLCWCCCCSGRRKKRPPQTFPEPPSDSSYKDDTPGMPVWTTPPHEQQQQQRQQKQQSLGAPPRSDVSNYDSQSDARRDVSAVSEESPHTPSQSIAIDSEDEEEEDASIPIYADGDPSETEQSGSTVPSQQPHRQVEGDDDEEDDDDDEEKNDETELTDGQEVFIEEYNESDDHTDSDEEKVDLGEDEDNLEEAKEEERVDESMVELNTERSISAHNDDGDHDDDDVAEGQEIFIEPYSEDPSEPDAVPTNDPWSDKPDSSTDTDVPTRRSSKEGSLKTTPTRKRIKKKREKVSPDPDMATTSSHSTYGLWEALDNGSDNSSSRENSNASQNSSEKKKKRSPRKSKDAPNQKGGTKQKTSRRKVSPRPEANADTSTAESQTSFGLWDVLDNDSSNSSSRGTQSTAEAKREEKTEPALSTVEANRRYHPARLDEVPMSNEKPVVEKPDTSKPEHDDPTLEESESTVRDEGSVKEDNISFSFDWILKSLR